jgi:hypothetical protein
VASFEVPPETSAYRVELVDSQSTFELSTQQRIVWDFESSHVDDGGRANPVVSQPTVEVSYDDGVSWKQVRVKPEGAQWKARVHPPQNAQYVSLRAATHDCDGNAVEQTLVRAYRLKNH